MVWSYIVPDDKKEFVEIPTLTIHPNREKKGLPRAVLIIGALIMLIALVIIVLAVMGMGA
jgi:hypothetical protein